MRPCMDGAAPRASARTCRLRTWAPDRTSASQTATRGLTGPSGGWSRCHPAGIGTAKPRRDPPSRDAGRGAHTGGRPRDVCLGLRDGRVEDTQSPERVDGASASGIHLEVEVRRATSGVTRIAHGPDLLAGVHLRADVERRRSMGECLSRGVGNVAVDRSRGAGPPGRRADGSLEPATPPATVPGTPRASRAG
jgi:hypothetical protein